MGSRVGLSVRLSVGAPPLFLSLLSLLSLLSVDLCSKPLCFTRVWALTARNHRVLRVALYILLVFNVVYEGFRSDYSKPSRFTGCPMDVARNRRVLGGFVL